ncbi:MAG TPA: hypothetical protein VLA54_12090 [Acidimicrobiia bacterium]|nr:hypothetical protein [Acidimicrobiia bacterium]
MPAERGLVTAQFMAVAALSMVFLALVLNLIAIQYAQGVIRAALDEGVRVGATFPAGEEDCRRAIDRVMAELMSGPLAGGITFDCAVGSGFVVATADAGFAGWIPGMPDLNFKAEVRAVKESDG